MSSAFRCEHCRELFGGTPYGSVEVNLKGGPHLTGTGINSGRYKKNDLCEDCAIELYKKMMEDDT